MTTPTEAGAQPKGRSSSVLVLDLDLALRAVLRRAHLDGERTPVLRLAGDRIAGDRRHGALLLELVDEIGPHLVGRRGRGEAHGDGCAMVVGVHVEAGQRTAG